MGWLPLPLSEDPPDMGTDVASQTHNPTLSASLFGALFSLFLRPIIL